MTFSNTLAAALLLLWPLSLSAEMAPAESPSVKFINQQISDPAQKFSDHYINVDGQQLHYVSAGSGKLILFYHGFPSYWYMWKNQLLDLAADYRVVAVDGLGANLSAKPNKLAPYHVSALSRQLNLLAKALAGDQGFVLVGHDWGGALAWSYAQQYPQGLDKLLVLNAPPTNLFLELLRSNPEQRKASTYIARLKDAAQNQTIDHNYADRMARMAYGGMVKRGLISKPEASLYSTALTQPGAVAGGIKWYQANIPEMDKIADADFWPSPKASTQVPSMLIWGEDDGTFVPAFIDRLPTYAKDLRIEVLPGIRHWPPLEAPDKVNSLIREFIEAP
ncbi:MAG: alpha/beta fold hydrolase [Porticoccaceae bacterium]